MAGSVQRQGRGGEIPTNPTTPVSQVGKGRGRQKASVGRCVGREVGCVCVVWRGVVGGGSAREGRRGN